MNDNASKLTDGQIEELVKKSQKGDSGAFAELYDEFFAPMYRYIFYKVNRSETDDILETLFLKAWENIKTYKKRKNITFKSWLFRIAHNLVVDHYRLSRTHQQLDPRLKDTKTDTDPIERAKRSLNSESLKKALSGLKKKHRDIIILKFINELSNEEISKVLRKSEGSVRIMQFRALRALKDSFESMGIKYLE